MFEVRHLQVDIDDIPILRDVSLQVAPGEIVTVIGPNGAGKSTLLFSIVNLLPSRIEGSQTRGEIHFLGKSILGFSPEQTVRLGIALVPEGARVFPQMTVLDNLRMGSYLPQARSERKTTLEEVFHLFPRLRERLNQKAHTLSGGERQMLAIGRALMAQPRLLLLDEPSLGLQPMLVQKTFETITHIRRRGVSILLVEQNVQFSLEISERAYVLENGRITMEGEAKALLKSDHIRKAYLAI
jgi:branched-chain amino acid transport system ATP-binding protein